MTRFWTAVVAGVACTGLLFCGCKKKEEAPPATAPDVTVVVPPPVPAELVQKGAEVFAKKCAACHAVNGVGGTVGPDLSKIGGTRDALYLQTQLQDPKAYNKDSKMPSFMDMAKEDKDAVVAYMLTLK